MPARIVPEYIHRENARLILNLKSTDAALERVIQALLSAWSRPHRIDTVNSTPCLINSCSYRNQKSASDKREALYTISSTSILHYASPPIRRLLCCNLSRMLRFTRAISEIVLTWCERAGVACPLLKEWCKEPSVVQARVGRVCNLSPNTVGIVYQQLLEGRPCWTTVSSRRLPRILAFQTEMEGIYRQLPIFPEYAETWSEQLRYVEELQDAGNDASSAPTIGNRTTSFQRQSLHGRVLVRLCRDISLRCVFGHLKYWSEVRHFTVHGAIHDAVFLRHHGASVPPGDILPSDLTQAELYVYNHVGYRLTVSEVSMTVTATDLELVCLERTTLLPHDRNISDSYSSSSSSSSPSFSENICLHPLLFTVPDQEQDFAQDIAHRLIRNYGGTVLRSMVTSPTVTATGDRTMMYHVHEHDDHTTLPETPMRIYVVCPRARSTTSGATGATGGTDRIFTQDHYISQMEYDNDADAGDTPYRPRQLEYISHEQLIEGIRAARKSAATMGTNVPPDSGPTLESCSPSDCFVQAIRSARTGVGSSSTPSQHQPTHGLGQPTHGLGHPYYRLEDVVTVPRDGMLRRQASPSLVAMDPIRFPTGTRLVCTSAPMGLGKSYQFKEFLTREHTTLPRILFLTCRCQQAQSIMGELGEPLGLVHYKTTQIKKKKKTRQRGEKYRKTPSRIPLNSHPRLVIQYESLHRLLSADFRLHHGYDVVVVDECRSVLAQSCASTNGEHLETNREVLRTLFTNSPRVLFADADMFCDGLVAYVIHEFWPSSIERRVVEYTATALNRHLVLTEPVSWYQSLLGDVLDGHRIMVAFRSKAHLHAVLAALRESGTFNALVFDRDSSEHDMSIFQSINTYLDTHRIQLLCFTSKVTAAADITVPFHRVYVHALGIVGPTARDMHQMIGRARSVTHPDVLTLLPPHGLTDRLNPKGLLSHELDLLITRREARMAHVSSIVRQCYVDRHIPIGTGDGVAWTPTWFLHIAAFQSLEQNEHFALGFRRHAIRKGYTIQTLDPGSTLETMTATSNIPTPIVTPSVSSFSSSSSSSCVTRGNLRDYRDTVDVLDTLSFCPSDSLTPTDLACIVRHRVTLRVAKCLRDISSNMDDATILARSHLEDLVSLQRSPTPENHPLATPLALEILRLVHACGFRDAVDHTTRIPTTELEANFDTVLASHTKAIITLSGPGRKHYVSHQRPLTALRSALQKGGLTIIRHRLRDNSIERKDQGHIDTRNIHDRGNTMEVHSDLASSDRRHPLYPRYTSYSLSWHNTIKQVILKMA